MADPGKAGLRDGWESGPPMRADVSAVQLPNDFNPNVSPADDRGAVVA